MRGTTRFSMRHRCILPALLITVALPTVRAQKADLSRLVVVGDSLSAGVQNISLLESQQPNGYASLIAKQAGVPLVLPLIKYPGLPNVLALKGFNPLPVIQPVSAASAAMPRDNPDVQATNLAEPGTTVAGALAPPALLPEPVKTWATAVLESPDFPGAPVSQVQEAVALKPTTVILWLGGNDALVPALVGLPIPGLTLTSVADFTGAFNAVMGALSTTGATLIVANVPNILEVPYFTPVQKVALAAHQSVKDVAKALGTGADDYLRTSALPLAVDILTGSAKGPLPSVCDAPFAGFPSPLVACVLTAAGAQIISSRVDSYNDAIKTAVAYQNQVKPGSAVLVNIHSLVDQIYKEGYPMPGLDLTANILGGLFSLDAIHPTNTGYAVIANRFIQTMNSQLNTAIPEVDVQKIARHDPLVPLLSKLF
jgi:lysophospholipase L1-like esterase